MSKKWVTLFIRPSFDGRIMVWLCPSVRPSVRRSLGLYKEFWHLDPCGQDIARTIWPRMLKLSVYTLYGQRKKPINFQGQRSNFKVTGPLQRILALGSLWAGYTRTIWPRMLKLSVYTLYGQRKKPINFQGQRSNFKVTGPLQRILELGSLWAGYSKNYLA